MANPFRRCVLFRYTFKPEISETSKKIVGNKSFEKRQEQYKQEKMYREKFERTQSPFVDPLSGQEFFQPKTGRSPNRQREGDIFSHLYQQSQHKTPPKTQDTRCSQAMIRRSGCRAGR